MPNVGLRRTVRKNCVDVCVGYDKGAIEICLSEKRALAKNRLGTTALDLQHKLKPFLCVVLPSCSHRRLVFF